MVSDRMWEIVFAEPFDDFALERAKAVGRVTVLDRCDEVSLRRALRRCDALLVRSACRVSRGALEEAERLRVIGRGGVGVENIDVEAARQRGIAVVYTPAAATDAVADLTVGLMIALLRGVVPGDAAVRAGCFDEVRRRARSRELKELTMGIVGMGRIGQAVARRCWQGFDMSIVYNDIVEPLKPEMEARPVSKEELYASADVISLHVPLTEETRGMIDDEVLAGCKPGSLLINTSRGAVVDGEALARRLFSGALAGAALDVFDPEPPACDHPLMTAPNTLFTPHLGARTQSGLARMNAVVEDVIRVLEGLPPRYVV